MLKPVILFFLAITLIAQETPRAPSTPDTIDRGHMYFSGNCGICHGADAQGGDKGPNLTTSQFKHGATDADLYRSITRGVPGTIMPANNLPPEQVWAIVAFLRSTVVAARAGTGGNRDAGEKFFWNSGKCRNCHMVNGRGGVLGPDLSHIGSAHTVQYLMTKLRDPNKEVTTGLREPNADYVVPISNSIVTVVTSTGQRIGGVAKNEDTFSIQMIGSDNEIHIFMKKDLKEVIHEQKSPMPAYTEKELSEAALKDLLAYLATLE
jgi:cytochrome c oxidase cbb3-type subunit 3